MHVLDSGTSSASPNTCPRRRTTLARLNSRRGNFHMVQLDPHVPCRHDCTNCPVLSHRIASHRMHLAPANPHQTLPTASPRNKVRAPARQAPKADATDASHPHARNKPCLSTNRAWPALARLGLRPAPLWLALAEPLKLALLPRTTSHHVDDVTWSPYATCALASGRLR